MPGSPVGRDGWHPSRSRTGRIDARMPADRHTASAALNPASWARAAADSLLPALPGVDRRLEMLAYLLVALVTVTPAALRPAAMVGDGADAFGTWWFFWWIRVAIEQLGDPSFTNLFFFPHGKEIFAHTGNNFVDAVLSVPLQWVLGDRYFPTWVFLMMLGNALCFRPLAREVLGDGFSACAATFLWMSNPALLFEIAAGRPTQAFLWAPPAALYFFLRLFRAERTGTEHWRRDAMGLGLAMAASGWTYWFFIYFLSFLLAPLYVERLWAARSAPGEIRSMVQKLAFAVGVCALLVLPAALPMIGALGDGSVPGAAPTAARSLTDLPAALANNVPPEGMGLWQMESQGEPLLTQPAWLLGLGLGLLGPTVLAARRRYAFCFFWLLIWALGAVIPVTSELEVKNLPYLALHHLDPFFRRLWFPYRVVLISFIPASLLVAGWVGARRERLGALGALALLGCLFRGTWPAPAHDVRPPLLLEELGGGALITLPMRIQSDLLMWQTRVQLPTLGGMGESAPAFWPPPFKRLMDNQWLRALRSAPVDPARIRSFEADDRLAVEALGYRWVLLRLDLLHSVRESRGPNEPPRPVPASEIHDGVAAVTRVVGAEPAAMQRSTVLWDLRGEFRPSTEDAVWSPARLTEVAAALTAPSR